MIRAHRKIAQIFPFYPVVQVFCVATGSITNFFGYEFESILDLIYKIISFDILYYQNWTLLFFGEELKNVLL